VRDPKYGFERIFCFEPASACWPPLEAVRDGRVTICRFGLWNETTEQPLYDAGSRGGSMYADKFRRAPAAEQVQLVRASDWFRENLGPDDEIYLKLNCEGAEVDIVEDLVESGDFARLRSAMIDPDVRKIPSAAHRERELHELLSKHGLGNYFMEEEAMLGPTHRARIQNWLRLAGAERTSLRVRIRQLLYLLSEAVRGRRSPLRDALTRPSGAGATTRARARP
jgi:FkbM family methyltransferase